MKIAKPIQKAEAPMDTGPITADNYLDRARRFASFGAEPFVIRALDGEKGAIRTKMLATEPQWIAWRAWFISKRISTRAMDAMGLATVPIEYPELFDHDWPTSDPFARLPRRGPQEMDRMSGRLSSLLAGLNQEVGAWPGEQRRRPQSAAQVKAEAERALAEKVIDWSTPAVFSDMARGELRLGPPPSQREDEEIDF
jgi:hypothetical protein